MSTFEVILTIINILAIIIVPIVAVFVGQKLQSYSQRRTDKLEIFKALMMNRGLAWNVESVRALNVIDIVLFTLIPISCAAPLSSETARIALPDFVLLTNSVSKIIITTVTATVTIVSPEIFKAVTLNFGTTDLKLFAAEPNISKAAFCNR